MQVESLYQEIILDHYKRPHGNGLRDPFDVEVHHVNPTCGDEITLRVIVSGFGEDAVIVDVSYEAQGCSISQASASVMFDLVAGESVDDALRTQDEFLHVLQGRGEAEVDEDLLGDAIAFQGVAKYPARVKCALLGWMALKDAVAQSVAAREEELES